VLFQPRSGDAPHNEQQYIPTKHLHLTTILGKEDEHITRDRGQRELALDDGVKSIDAFVHIYIPLIL